MCKNPGVCSTSCKNSPGEVAAEARAYPVRRRAAAPPQSERNDYARRPTAATATASEKPTDAAPDFFVSADAGDGPEAAAQS